MRNGRVMWFALFVWTIRTFASCESDLSGADHARAMLEANLELARIVRKHAIDPDEWIDADAYEATARYSGRLGRALNSENLDPLRLLRRTFGHDPKVADYSCDLERRLHQAGLRLRWNDVDACESVRTSGSEIKLGAYRLVHPAPVAACLFHVEHELRHAPVEDGWRDRTESHADYVRRRFEVLMEDELKVRLAEREILKRLRDLGFDAPDEIVSSTSLDIWAAADAGATREELQILVGTEYADFTVRALTRDWARLQRSADVSALRRAITDEVLVGARHVLATSLWARTMRSEERLAYLESLASELESGADSACPFNARLTELRRRMLSEPDAFDP